MNRTDQTSALAAGPWTLAAMIAAAALTRLLPHPPNFSPVEAMALFGGAYFASRRAALWVPLLAMLLSDVALGLLKGGLYWSHMTDGSFLLVYACIALTAFAGYALRGRVNGARVLGWSLAGSVFFFLVTNFGVWASGTMYPKNGAGLMACYVAGLPFFQWAVLGTLLYSAVLFGGFELLRRRVPALRAQTV
ncbi:DUF6580 family putative transport protein [Solilutibacter silvestris]|uniref:Uncharacterized protein n=1 Tax=Solilutibacter silvestris TaxID=1645665 RepID=A0A2K1PXJ9_9GAMM|nr:DUF6580 family putative transport protein [Lysobacter silvestris]PNS07513.1 hypothetical protein Lysil_1689 [Lysobacter silvestris]